MILNMRFFNTIFPSLFMLVVLFSCVGCSNEHSSDDVKVEKNVTPTIENKPKPVKPIDRSLLNTLKVEKDEMRELTFYSHKSGPVYLHDDIYLYIVETKEHELSLRLYLKYYSESWLFVNRAWTKIDGNPIDLPTQERWDRDNAAGDIWETSDKYLTDNDANLIKKLASSASPTIRFEGDRLYSNYKPSRKRLDAMLEIIKAYELAKGIELK